MNLLKLTFCMLLAVAFIACDKDDDAQKNCKQSDWVGTYDGTIDCSGVEDDVVVIITASGSEDINIEYVVLGLSTEVESLTPDGCKVDHSESGGGFSLSVDATLDGDNFNYEEVYTILGIGASCTITATRR